MAAEPSLQLTFPRTLACVGLPWLWQSLYSRVAHIGAPEDGVILLLSRVLCPVPASEQLPMPMPKEWNISAEIEGGSTVARLIWIVSLEAMAFAHSSQFPAYLLFLKDSGFCNSNVLESTHLCTGFFL